MDQFISGADISEDYTIYYLQDWDNLGTLENPYIDSMFGLIYEFFIFLELSASLGRQLAICRESWVVIYAHDSFHGRVLPDCYLNRQAIKVEAFFQW